MRGTDHLLPANSVATSLGVCRWCHIGPLGRAPCLLCDPRPNQISLICLMFFMTWTIKNLPVREAQDTWLNLPGPWWGKSDHLQGIALCALILFCTLTVFFCVWKFWSDVSSLKDTWTATIFNGTPFSFRCYVITTEGKCCSAENGCDRRSDKIDQITPIFRQNLFPLNTLVVCTPFSVDIWFVHTPYPFGQDEGFPAVPYRETWYLRALPTQPTRAPAFSRAAAKINREDCETTCIGNTPAYQSLIPEMLCFCWYDSQIKPPENLILLCPIVIELPFSPLFSPLGASCSPHFFLVPLFFVSPFLKFPHLARVFP